MGLNSYDDVKLEPYLSVGDVVKVKLDPKLKGRRFVIKDKRKDYLDFMYMLIVDGKSEWFIEDVLIKTLDQTPPCDHPKGEVYVNSANGVRFRFCKKCREDLGDI